MTELTAIPRTRHFRFCRRLRPKGGGKVSCRRPGGLILLGLGYKKKHFTPCHTAVKRVPRWQGARSYGASVKSRSNHPTSSPKVFLTSAPLAGGETFSTAFTLSPCGPSSSTAAADVVSLLVSMTTVCDPVSDEDCQKGDCAKAVDNISPPVKDAEVRNTFGKLLDSCGFGSDTGPARTRDTSTRNTSYRDVAGRKALFPGIKEETAANLPLLLRPRSLPRVFQRPL